MRVTGGLRRQRAALGLTPKPSLLAACSLQRSAQRSRAGPASSLPPATAQPILNGDEVGGEGRVTRDNGHQLVLPGSTSFPLLPMGHKSKREMSGGETKGKAVRLPGPASGNAQGTSLGSARLRGPWGRRAPLSRSLRPEGVGLGLTGAGSGQGMRGLGSVQGGAAQPSSPRLA